MQVKGGEKEKKKTLKWKKWAQGKAIETRGWMSPKPKSILF